MAKRISRVDRVPYICAAGKPCDYSRTLKECLNYYPLEDKVNALKHEAHIPDKKPMFKYKLPPLINSRHQGIFTDMKEVLGNPPLTRFQSLIKDLKETTYQSYWTAEEGKVKDSVGNLPLHIDPVGTTFGNPTKRESTVQELINPNKNYGQVFDEYIKGHELYKKSHNDYFPNEPKNRKYLQPPYNPNVLFGEKKGYDSRGLMLKSVMTEKNKDNYSVVNTILSDFQSKFTPQLGKVSKPNRNENCVPEGQTYGFSKKTTTTLPELLTENEKPKIQEEIEYLLTHIIQLRNNLKNRFNRHLFSFIKFLDSLRYWDKTKSGWLPISKADEVCKCFAVYFDEKEVKRFLTLFGIIQGDQINYIKFVDLLNFQADSFEIKNIYHIPPRNQYYETSYTAALNDYKEIDNSKYRTAGIPSNRYDLPWPTTPEGGCKANNEDLGAETAAAILANPTVYCQYGLTFYDLFQERQKDEIRQIFKNSGYEMDDETFEKLWNEGYEIDKTGLVCAATFKDLIRKHKIKYKSLKSK